jgi:hypothetical protein
VSHEPEPQTAPAPRRDDEQALLVALFRYGVLARGEFESKEHYRERLAARNPDDWCSSYSSPECRCSSTILVKQAHFSP